VRTRRGTRARKRADGDELESWLHDLVDGEATARRYRERLRAEGATPEDAFTVSSDAEAETHAHDRHTA
jgi:hypothetical protein